MPTCRRCPWGRNRFDLRLASARGVGDSPGAVQHLTAVAGWEQPAKSALGSDQVVGVAVPECFQQVAFITGGARHVVAFDIEVARTGGVQRVEQAAEYASQAAHGGAGEQPVAVNDRASTPSIDTTRESWRKLG